MHRTWEHTVHLLGVFWNAGVLVKNSGVDINLEDWGVFRLFHSPASSEWGTTFQLRVTVPTLNSRGQQGSLHSTGNWVPFLRECLQLPK